MRTGKHLSSTLADFPRLGRPDWAAQAATPAKGSRSAGVVGTRLTHEHQRLNGRQMFGPSKPARAAGMPMWLAIGALMAVGCLHLQRDVGYETAGLCRFRQGSLRSFFGWLVHQYYTKQVIAYVLGLAVAAAFCLLTPKTRAMVSGGYGSVFASDSGLEPADRHGGIQSPALDATWAFSIFFKLTFLLALASFPASSRRIQIVRELVPSAG